MRQELILVLLVVSAIIGFILLTQFLADLNRRDALESSSFSTSIASLRNTSTLHLVYHIKNDQTDYIVYQCGVDVLSLVGIRYGKTVSQVYVINSSQCFLNNIYVDTYVCYIDMFSRHGSYYIIVDPNTDTPIDSRKRALILNPILLENCSNLIN